MMDFPILELLQDCEDPPLGSDEVAQLQEALGVTFPREYGEFLLQFNGGSFKRPVMFFVPNTERFAEGVGISSFIGHPVDRAGHDGIVWNAQHLTDRLPPDYLAIADCNSEDFVLLRFSEQGSRFEGVWFWDGPGFWCPEQGENIHWLADSFNEFLSMLQYDTYYDEEQQESDELFHAIEVGKRRAVEDFLSGDGNVETQNSRGQSLLAAATIYSWPKIVRLLLEHGADPDARDEPCTQQVTVQRVVACRVYWETRSLPCPAPGKIRYLLPTTPPPPGYKYVFAYATKRWDDANKRWAHRPYWYVVPACTPPARSPTYLAPSQCACQ